MVEELAPGKVILISAEREAGPTNSLWWISISFASDAEHVPVYVRFPQLQCGEKAFEKTLQEALARVSVAVEPGKLPSMILAVDDVDLSRPKVLARLVDHFKSDPESIFRHRLS